MGFLDDLGTFGKDIFTGRWTGGETNVVQDVKNDPWVLAAPAALAAGGIGLGAAAGAGGLGALFGGEALAEGAAAGGAGEAFAFAPEAAAGSGDLSGFLAAPDAALGGGTATSDLAFNAAPLAENAPIGGNISDFVGPPVGGGGPDQLAASGGAGFPLDSSGTAFGPAGGGGGAPGGGGGMLDTLTSPSKWTLGGVAQGAGAAIAGAGLGMNLMKGNSVPASQDRLTNQGAFNAAQAQELIGESKQLRSYLENGSLPKAQQAAVDQALKAEKARIIANHAKNGASTDPTQNSALAQDISAAERNALIMAGELEKKLFEAGNNLLQSGLHASGLSTDVYKALVAMDRGDTAELNKSIANFASALGGGGAKISLTRAA